MSKKLYEKMNLYLANQEVAYIKLHNLHWYVKGRSFFTLHAKLEELYDQTAEIIDAVAERLLAVGQAPVANMKEALALATITPEAAAQRLRNLGMKISGETMRAGLIQGVYPFGIAIKTETSAVFQVFPRLLDQWIAERIQEEKE